MERSILVLIGIVFLAGCATTQQPNAVNQLQIKVAQLERKMEEKDQEISDLKDTVDQLSSQPSSNDNIIADETDETSSNSVKNSSAGTASEEGIIRVSASSKDVQRALKNAGYYDGAVDGKVGQKTKQAIEKFQKEHNLRSDGIIGKQTWTELKIYLD